tara:strand:- start:81 stop:887 length:807 start_codon:yes stop_codon:yes gene_type:complete
MDRYGSNSIPWITAIYLTEEKNNKLYHNCSGHCNRYKNNIIHQLLIKKSASTNDKKIIEKDLHKRCHWATTYNISQLSDISNISFPDQFHNSPLYNEIRLMYDEKYNKFDINETIKINEIKEGTIIHVRLDDVRVRPNVNYPHLQSFIGKDNLIKLIEKVYKRFQTRVYLMTTPNKQDIEICKNALEKCSEFLQIEHSKLNNYILGSNDIDFDIYTMMQCKNLIISKSVFTFIPAILHKNTVYTYTEWEHYWDLIGDSKISKKIQILQ